MTQKAPMCRFFQVGKCKNGTSCTFSHDLAHTDSFVCPYFVKGQCKYGDRCMYDHHKPGTTTDSNPSTRASHHNSGRSQQWETQQASTHPKPSSATMSAAVPSIRPGNDMPVCVYFQRGLCNFGDSCRFRHELLSASTPAATSLPPPTDALAALALSPLAPLTQPHSQPQPTPSTTSRMAVLSPQGAVVPPSAQDGPQPGDPHSTTKTCTVSAWAAPQSQPPASEANRTGFTLFDDNEDLQDPWEMARCPASVPRRSSATAGMLPAESEVLCEEFAITGACPLGDACACLHAEQCACCQLFVMHPTNEELRAAHEVACTAMQERAAQQVSSEEMECVICLETVLSKPNPAGRKFGLLDCHHCFCLSCIRDWRSNTFADVDEATRTCPQCRKPSHYVTPSSVWPRTREEKEEIVDKYKAQLARVHCRHYDRGRGSCPFGTSCFYRHENEDGSMQERDPGLLRMATNADGVYTAVRPMQLAGFLESDRAQALLRRRAAGR